MHQPLQRPDPFPRVIRSRGARATSAQSAGAGAARSWPGRLVAAARSEASRDWNTSGLAALLWFCAPLGALPAFALLWLLDKPLLRFLTDEDGPFEWAQVLLFLVAAVASAGVAVHLLRAGSRAVGCLFVLLAAGLGFIVGEELAWGQRFLAFATPDALAAINSKEEVSLHNIASIEKWFTRGKLAAGLYGVFGAWLLLAASRHFAGSAWRACVVPVFLSSPFLIVLAMRLLRLTLLRSDLPAGYGEFEELVLAFGFAAFSAQVLRCRHSLAAPRIAARSRAHPHPRTRRARAAA